MLPVDYIATRAHFVLPRRCAFYSRQSASYALANAGVVGTYVWGISGVPKRTQSVAKAYLFVPQPEHERRPLLYARLLSPVGPNTVDLSWI
jgi:hypothetical protein